MTSRPDRKDITSIERRSKRLYTLESHDEIIHPLSLYSLASFFLLFFLFLLTEPRHSFLLMAGETLKIPMLNSVLSKKQYVVHVKDGYEGSLETYSLETCPTLTGNIVNIDYTTGVSLNENEYHFDYFIFYPGSIIYAKVKAIRGSAYFRLLSGDLFQLETLRSGKDLDINSFRQIEAKYISDGNEDGTGFAYRAKDGSAASRGHVWILFFENASSSETILNVRYAVQATSFNLQAFKPGCTSYDNAPCTLPVKDCTIIKTIGSANFNSGDYDSDVNDDYNANDDMNQDAQEDGDGDDANGDDDRPYYSYTRSHYEEIEVDVFLYRQWFALLSFAALPVLFGYLQVYRPWEQYMKQDGDHYVQSRDGDLPSIHSMHSARNPPEAISASIEQRGQSPEGQIQKSKQGSSNYSARHPGENESAVELGILT